MSIFPHPCMQLENKHVQICYRDNFTVFLYIYISNCHFFCVQKGVTVREVPRCKKSIDETDVHIFDNGCEIKLVSYNLVLDEYPTVMYTWNNQLQVSKHRGYYKHCEMKGDNVLSNTVLVGHDHLIN